jgi:hypothetical protein
VAKEILFPDREPVYLFDRDCLAFRALVEGRPVECMITAELLLSRFGARDMTEGSLREAYRKHRAGIQAIARDHIENGWIDADHRLFLTTRFTRLTVTFDSRLGEWREGRALAEQAHRVLTELIGPNAETVNVEWAAAETRPGEAGVLLRLEDPAMSFSVSAAFDAGKQNNAASLGLFLGQVWAGFLRERSRRLSLKSG